MHVSVISIQRIASYLGQLWSMTADSLPVSTSSAVIDRRYSSDTPCLVTGWTVHQNRVIAQEDGFG
jgi:hypothetical protein